MKSCPYHIVEKKHPFKRTSKKAILQASATEAQSDHDNEQQADDTATQEQIVNEEQADNNVPLDQGTDAEQAENDAPQEQGTDDELDTEDSIGWSSAPTVLANHMIKSTGKIRR